MKYTFLKKIIFAALIGGLLAVVFVFRIYIKEGIQILLKPELPQPKEVAEFSGESESLQVKVVAGDRSKVMAKKQKELKVQEENPPTPHPSPLAPLPSTFNLNIPFASQAPFGNWDLPYKEACEEAAVIMAYSFLKNQPLNKEIMNEKILQLVDWEKKTFGYYEDTNAEEIARTLREYFNIKDVEVRYEFTIEDIKREVSKGHPVILPAAGRLLPNPNFRQPGPIYHALVVKGYTEKHIITNDPGTRRGKDFLYTPEALMNAIHDWNAQNILEGRKAMVVVKK